MKRQRRSLLVFLALRLLAASVALTGTVAFADGMPSPLPPDNAHPIAPVADTKPAARDPLTVDAGIAVKDTAPREIDLPGVLHLSGERATLLDPSRARVITLTNGGSQTVYLSVTDPNRIQLPFANPHIISTTDIDIDKRVNSNNIYITFNGAVTHPVQLFVEPPEGGVVLGLQLVPKRIPSQTLIVEDDAKANTSVTGDQTLARKSNDYVNRIEALMQTAALGGLPEGYSRIDAHFPPIAMNGLMVEVARRLSHRDADIYVYTVTNPGKQDALLQETEFDGDNVLAVSIFPTPLLHPDEKTLVIVLAGKHGVP